MFFFFNDTATTEIYTLSLHDALPIYAGDRRLDLGAAQAHFDLATHRLLGGAIGFGDAQPVPGGGEPPFGGTGRRDTRSEEHTSELQSRQYLVCRLLLEKKKKSTQKKF